jgi:hypothetical protein
VGARFACPIRLNPDYQDARIFPQKIQECPSINALPSLWVYLFRIISKPVGARLALWEIHYATKNYRGSDSNFNSPKTTETKQ